MSFVHILLHHLRLCSFNVPNETSLLVSPLCFGPLSKRMKTGVPKWLASNRGKVINQGDANPCNEGYVNTREESVQSPADQGQLMRAKHVLEVSQQGNQIVLKYEGYVQKGLFLGL